MSLGKIKVTLKINVVDSVKDITKKIANSVRDELNYQYSNSISKIQPIIIKQIATSIQESPTYQELVSDGQLRGELGVISPGPELEEMIQRINNTHRFKFSRLRSTGTGSVIGRFEVAFIDTAHIDYFLSSGGSFVSEPSGSTIEWMKWLFTLGDKIIIKNYSFVASRRGRTGKGTMIKEKKSGWRVPPEHSGTPTDNFVTRAINNDFDKIVQIIIDEIK